MGEDLWTFICYVLLVWYVIILIVAYLGFFEIYANYSDPKLIIPSSTNSEDYEPVTILRPIKGIDPELYTCLESSFIQNYPIDKIEVIFCVDDEFDESMPVLKQLISSYPKIDAKIFVSQYDEQGQKLDYYGPNPKVNNLAKGFSNSKYDIIWVMDSNVWGGSNILMNSIEILNNNLLNDGSKNPSSRPVRLVHHVPLALSINTNSSFLSRLGNKLDEVFLFSSHSKFYISLNKLNIAPCVNGKSNIFRKLDLDLAVSRIPTNNNKFFRDLQIKQSAKSLSDMGRGNSLKFFSKYIGEDNMIAIALWEFLFCRTALSCDMVIQPLNKVENSKTAVKEYFKRRIRWLRVRKFMVHLATLIEPTTESLVCGVFGTISISNLWFDKFFIKKMFCFHLLVWYLTDLYQYRCLMSNVNQNYHPTWFKYSANDTAPEILEWSLVWCLRELFAFPIWLIAMMGHEIDWRGKPFRIKPDLTAEEL